MADHGKREVAQDLLLEGVLRVAADQRREANQQYKRSVERFEQHVIDAEVVATRLSLLRLARRHSMVLPGYLDPDFLAVADRPTVAQAIIEATLTMDGITAADLQLLDLRDNTLRIQASHGFTTDFLSQFRTVDIHGRTACALAWRTRQSVIVDRVEGSPVFPSGPEMEAMLAAGSRSVYSYPLFSTTGLLLGVLSFHARRPLATQTQLIVAARSGAVALGAAA